MSSNIIFYASFVLLGTFISSLAQVWLKGAAIKKYNNLKDEYFNKSVIAAYSVFIISTLLSVYAYKVIPLSMGAVLESTSYFYVTIFGAYFFKERITTRKIVALLLIVIGIVVYSCSI